MKNGNFVGPPRVWIKNKNLPGLMMTRSFGDEVGKKCGVSSEPDVRVLDLNQNFKGVVLTSDGVSDKINSSMIAKICENIMNSNGEAINAAQEIIRKAYIKWRKVRLSLIYLEFRIYG